MIRDTSLTSASFQWSKEAMILSTVSMIIWQMILSAVSTVSSILWQNILSTVSSII